MENLIAHAPGTEYPVLRGISFAVQEGTVLGVIGPSAAGKSSLARVLVGAWQATAGAVRLDGAIDHLRRHARHHHLDHRNLAARGLVADRIHQVCGLQCEDPRLLDVDARLGDVRADRPLLGERLAESDPGFCAPAQRLQGALGQSNQPHAVVDAAWTKAALGNLEAAPLAQEQVGNRHAHVLEYDLGVAVRGVVVAEDV